MSPHIDEEHNILAFLRRYVENRERKRISADEAAASIVSLGQSAIEATAIAVNDCRTFSQSGRGTISHLLMTVLTHNPGLGTEAIRHELEAALSDADFFVSANAEESLIAMGITKIGTIPVKGYSRRTQDTQSQRDLDDLNALLR